MLNVSTWDVMLANQPVEFGLIFLSAEKPQVLASKAAHTRRKLASSKSSCGSVRASTILNPAHRTQWQKPGQVHGDFIARLQGSDLGAPVVNTGARAASADRELLSRRARVRGLQSFTHCLCQVHSRDSRYRCFRIPDPMLQRCLWAQVVEKTFQMQNEYDLKVGLSLQIARNDGTLGPYCQLPLPPAAPVPW